MRVRLERIGGPYPFVVAGVALDAPEVGKPFRILTADGTSTASCTTDIAEILPARSGGGIEFRTITGNFWRVERTDLDQLVIAERMEQA